MDVAALLTSLSRTTGLTDADTDAYTMFQPIADTPSDFFYPQNKSRVIVM